MISKSKWQRTTHETMSERFLARATLAVMLHHHIWEKIDDVQIKLGLVDFGLNALISKSKWQRTTLATTYVSALFVKSHTLLLCYVIIFKNKIEDGQIKLSLVDFSLNALISKSKWQRTTLATMAIHYWAPIRYKKFALKF